MYTLYFIKSLCRKKTNDNVTKAKRNMFMIILITRDLLKHTLQKSVPKFFFKYLEFASLKKHFFKFWCFFLFERSL